MLPFVYNGEEEDSGGYERRYRRHSRLRSRSRSRSRSYSRSRSRSNSRSSRRNRRYRDSHWSRMGSDSPNRDDSDRSRDYRQDRDRMYYKYDDRSSGEREPEKFMSAIPYLSSLHSQYDRSSQSSHVMSAYGQPHYKIVLKKLPQDLQRETLMGRVAHQGFRVKDIRIIHKGPDRCFGFVEFPDVNSAQAWMEYNKGTLELGDGRFIKMEYSCYDSLDGRSSNANSSRDWMCAKCTIKNFKNRGSCFKCNLTRIESDNLARKGYAAIGVAKCDTLLLREIPLKCTETAIEAELSRVSSMEVLRVHIAESGLYAYVQMRSADDAERLMLTFNQFPLIIYGCTVMVTYSRLPLNTVLSMSLANESTQKAVDTVNQLPAFQPSAGNAGNPGVEAAQLAIAKAALIRQMTLSGTPAGDSTYSNVVSKNDGDVLSTVDLRNAGVPLEGFALGNASAGTATVHIDLGVTDTPWGTFKKYSPPNPTLFQYEASSGLYYDPTTGLYYDSNSQYYWDANSQKWNSWNPTYQAYIPCDLISEKAASSETQNRESGNEVPEKAVVSNAGDQNASVCTSEAEKKAEPQKSAKDIAREMAKWARRQSKVLLAVKATPKLETTSPLAIPIKQKGTTEATADITYKMLEKAKNPLGSPSDDEEDLPPPNVAATGISRPPLTVNSLASTSDTRETTNTPPTVNSLVGAENKDSETEETFVDLERKFCILCKRKFGSLEILMKHVKLSELHKKNVEAHLAQKSVNDLRQASMTSTYSYPKPQQYRDRAKERRNMFGLDPSGFTNDVGTSECADYSAWSQEAPLDESNIGNKLLRSMGWSEGTGIGKNNQGIVAPITAERRVEGAGLGAAGSRMLHGANASRRERAHYSMLSRYQEDIGGS